MIAMPAPFSAIFDTNLQKTIYHSISSSYGVKDVLSAVSTPRHNCSIINSKSSCVNLTRFFYGIIHQRGSCSNFNTNQSNSN
jgi:hypothetical protein